jgi:hypothetical protein
VSLTPNSVRSEAEIKAPIDHVWRILTNMDGYDDWNPFTPKVETTLEIGDPIHLCVRLVGKITLNWVETMTRNQPYTLGWGMDLGSPLLLHAERIQVLTPIDEGSTHYMTEDCFTGWLHPVALGLFGRSMERGFHDCGVGLKKAAERGLSELNQGERNHER